MSDKSINEACRECPEIKSLVERARTDEWAKRDLETHAVRYVSSLLECIETYDDCVSYQADINDSLQRIADSSRRRADLYQELSDSSTQTLKRMAEMIPEIVNGAVNRVVSDLIEHLNEAGVLASGLGLERGEPLEFMKPISVDLDIAEIQGTLKLTDSPKLTLYAVSRASILTKTKEALRANRESGILEFRRGSTTSLSRKKPPGRGVNSSKTSSRWPTAGAGLYSWASATTVPCRGKMSPRSPPWTPPKSPTRYILTRGLTSKASV